VTALAVMDTAADSASPSLSPPWAWVLAHAWGAPNAPFWRDPNRPHGHRIAVQNGGSVRVALPSGTGYGV